MKKFFLLQRFSSFNPIHFKLGLKENSLKDSKKEQNMSTVSEQINIIQKTRYGITAFGVVGNLISALIFSRKTFRNNSIGIYCRTLALVEMLLTSLQLINQSFTLFATSDVFATVSAPCKIILYSNTGVVAISAWMTVVLSIDKLLCVLYPQR